MFNFQLEIWDDESKLCTFYSVRFLGEELSETDKFFDRFYEIEEYKESVRELLIFILKSIGEDHGAQDIFFNRNENEVSGLPFHGKIKLSEINYHFPNFPLRLYAVRLRDNIVILFNGGIKDGATNQESSLYLKWQEACQFARRIDEAILSQELFIDEKIGLITDGFSDEIIEL